MARIIKFKAWDKENKKMLKHHEINFNWLQTGDFDYFIPMQYTGLNDKNKKPIYEGDILSMHNGQYNSQVIWDTDGYVADHIGNGGSESITTWIEDCEIIGNIYENPELLK